MKYTVYQISSGNVKTTIYAISGQAEYNDLMKVAEFNTKAECVKFCNDHTFTLIDNPAWNVA